MRALFLRLVDALLRRSREQRLDAEIQEHLDLLAADFEAKGLSPRDAMLAARRAFGGVDQIKERYRDQRGFRLVTELIQDTRYAARLMSRERWFTIATVLALSLGIGATTTMATILYSMNLRGLPFPEAFALVGVTGEPTRSQGPQIALDVFEQWRSATHSFEGLAGEIDSPINMGDEVRGTDQFAGTYLSSNAFQLLRVRPIVGRDFRPEDDRPGAPSTALIGYRVWSDRFGLDQSIVGRVVRLNGEPATVIGVMPEGFAYPVDTQVWRPLASFPNLQTANRAVRVVGRLAQGISPQRAQSELAALLSTLNTASDADRRRRTIVMPLNETYFGKLTQPVPMLLLGASLVVLLIACSHAASLLLARSSTRARELSMRAALGAGRGRLIQQLLVESVAIALLAGLVGFAIASVFVNAFAKEVTQAGLPYWTHFTFDVRLTSVIAVLSIGAGITFGIVPAIQQSRTNLGEVLNQFGRSGMTSPRTKRLSAILLVGELAVTVVLLSAALALVRSAHVLYEADARVDLDDLWELRLLLPTKQYADAAARRTFLTSLEERLASSPAMKAATLAARPPFNAGETRGLVVDGPPPVDGAALPRVAMVAIGPRYFETLGLSLVRGVTIEEVDAASAGGAALVNERFAARFFPDIDPIGRDVVLINDRVPGASPQRFRIVGIAPPLRQQQQSGHTPVIYTSLLSQPGLQASLIVRGHPDQFASVIREHVRQLDPDLPVFNLQPLSMVSYMSRFTQRIMSTVFSIVAMMASALSALGLYSLAAYAAAQRTHEVGVRMALGAQRSQVSWMFLRQTLGQASVGLTLGLAGAAAIGVVLQSLLVEVHANDPMALASVAVFVLVVAVVAGVAPARRAARLDAVAALRRD